MKITALASVAAMLSGMIPTSSATPTPQGSRTSIRPFNLIVSSPSRQTLVAEYSTCSGKLTSLPSKAASYSFSDIPPFGELHCSDSSNVSGKLGFSANSVDLAPYTGKDGTFATFSLDANMKLQFANDKLGKATWVLRGGAGGENVEAYFGGMTTQDYILVSLQAQFPLLSVEAGKE